MWEARGNSSSFHCPHQSEERFLIHHAGPVVLTSLHCGDAIFFKRGRIKKIHRTCVACTPQRMAGAKNQVRSVSELDEVGLVFNVDSPNFIVIAERWNNS